MPFTRQGQQPFNEEYDGSRPHRDGVDRELIQTAVQKLFWERTWYSKTVKAFPTHLIGERPAVRLSNTPILYATSHLLAGDSLNWFIEASVVPYPGSDVVRLSDKAFNDLVTRPFEDSVIQVFRSHGFSAGRVSDRGVWQTQTGHFVLTNVHHEKIPGEVDVLAFHEVSRTVVIIECKVISVPLQRNAMRNIARKLGASDQEEFHSKLEKKVSWLKDAEPFSSVPNDNWFPFIALDVKTRWVSRGKYPVIDFQELNDYMARVDPVHEFREHFMKTQ